MFTLTSEGMCSACIPMTSSTFLAFFAILHNESSRFVQITFLMSHEVQILSLSTVTLYELLSPAGACAIQHIMAVLTRLWLMLPPLLLSFQVSQETQYFILFLEQDLARTLKCLWIVLSSTSDQEHHCASVLCFLSGRPCSKSYGIACQNFNEHALDMLRICLNLIFHFREIQGEISWLCTDEQSW